MSERAYGIIDHDSAMLENCLKLDCGFATLLSRQIRQSAHIDWIERCQLIRSSDPKNFDGLQRVFMVERKLGTNSWQRLRRSLTRG